MARSPSSVSRHLPSCGPHCSVFSWPMCFTALEEVLAGKTADTVVESKDDVVSSLRNAHQPGATRRPMFKPAWLETLGPTRQSRPAVRTIMTTLRIPYFFKLPDWLILPHSAVVTHYMIISEGQLGWQVWRVSGLAAPYLSILLDYLLYAVMYWLRWFLRRACGFLIVLVF